MAKAKTPTVGDRYQKALETFVDRAKADPYIVAVVLCGSLSHDTVWQKSDIDLLVIEKDADKGTHGKGGSAGHFALVEDDINIHAIVMPRSGFRRSVEGAIQNSFMHSLLAKSKLVYTNDPTLNVLFGSLQKVGTRDQQVQLMGAGSGVILPLYKAQKWFHVRKDMHYSFVYIMSCVVGLAKVEVISAGQICGREVIQQAIALNPKFFNAIYTDLIDIKKTPKVVEAALTQIDDYLTRRTRAIFGPILEHLQDAGGPRSATELETHFSNQLGVSDVVTACEWLSDKDVIRKVSTPVRLTKKSPVSFEELAFYYDG